MASHQAVLRGVIHGRTVELEVAPELPDGQIVSVTLDPVLSPEEGIRRSAGAWAEDAEELDEFLEEMRRSRQQDRPEPA